jgi:hypothetical protein
MVKLEKPPTGVIEHAIENNPQVFLVGSSQELFEGTVAA